jgi:hypothetical protein
VISPEDLDLFQYADDPQTALQILTDGLTEHYLEPKQPLPEFERMIPAIAKSRV